ncbi:MAG: hypothetical protein ACXAEX_15380 [Promethearchaeota archaeon]
MGKLKLEFDEALELCEQVRVNNRNKWISFNKLWCWGCAKFTKSPERRCFANSGEESNDGCAQVNKLYRKLNNTQ